MKRASVRGNTKIKNIRRESIPNKSRKRGNFIEIFPNLYKLNGVKEIFDLREGRKESEEEEEERGNKQRS